MVRGVDPPHRTVEDNTARPDFQTGPSVEDVVDSLPHRFQPEVLRICPPLQQNIGVPGTVPCIARLISYLLVFVTESSRTQHSDLFRGTQCVEIPHEDHRSVAGDPVDEGKGLVCFIESPLLTVNRFGDQCPLCSYSGLFCDQWEGGGKCSPPRELLYRRSIAFSSAVNRNNNSSLICR